MNRDIKLGISIYPENQDINEIKEYVKLASKYGYTRIFTSILQVTEDNKDEMISKFKIVLSWSMENLSFWGIEGYKVPSTTIGNNSKAWG